MSFQPARSTINSVRTPHDEAVDAWIAEHVDFYPEAGGLLYAETNAAALAPLGMIMREGIARRIAERAGVPFKP